MCGVRHWGRYRTLIACNNIARQCCLRRTHAVNDHAAKTRHALATPPPPLLILFAPTTHIPYSRPPHPSILRYLTSPVLCYQHVRLPERLHLLREAHLLQPQLRYLPAPPAAPSTTSLSEHTALAAVAITATAKADANRGSRLGRVRGDRGCDLDERGIVYKFPSSSSVCVCGGVECLQQLVSWRSGNYTRGGRPIGEGKTH